MPLHLNSLMDDRQADDLIGWILTKGMDEYDSLCVSPDNRFIHFQCPIPDAVSGEPIGRLVYTVAIEEQRKALKILDIDIVFQNPSSVQLQFLSLLEGSSDANEYYEAEVVSEGQHLEIETVNRHAAEEELLHNKREVFISVFPFQLSIHKSMDAYNKAAGFGRKKKVGESGFEFKGLSEHFIMPALTLSSQNRKEHYSFLIGKVLSFREVEAVFGPKRIRFVLAQLDTGLGVVPVGMSRDVFDLSKLKVGRIVVMKADIKADVSTRDAFTSSSSGKN